MAVGLSLTTDAAPTKRRGNWWLQLSPKARVGVIIITVFVLVAIIGPELAPYDPSYQNPLPSLSLQAPSLHHLLGTTETGEDVFSELLVGIRATMLVGFLTGLIATGVAVIIGITAGFKSGGAWDEVLSLLTNVFLVLPALPLLVVLIGYLPGTGQTATILVLSLLGWPWGARVIRAQTLSLRSRDFVAASRETGERTWRIIFFEILPNEVSLIAASFVGTVLYAIATSVGLAFLGLAGSSWSLGTILYWSQSDNALQLGAWWWFLPAGLCVAFIGTGLVLLNFGLDELGNPRLRDAAFQKRIGGHAWRPADPTPVLLDSAIGGGGRRQRQADRAIALRRERMIKNGTAPNGSSRRNGSSGDGGSTPGQNGRVVAEPAGRGEER
jgi:peptide/nickel transport system permease protein